MPRQRSIWIHTSTLAVATVLGVAASTLVTSSGVASSTAPGSATAQEKQGAPPRLLPDLTPLRAVDVSIQKEHGKRMLRFQAGLANIGIAPMEVRPDRRKKCPSGKRHSSQVIYRDVDGNDRYRRAVDKKFTRRDSGCMVFHPEHNHWHFQAASRYLFYQPGREHQAIKHARKMSFCLRDSMRVPARYGTFNVPLYYRECGRDTPQGISRGWVDVYQSFLSGQAIPLPRRVDNGLYCVSIRVDPLNRLWESNERNNLSTRTIRIKHRTQVSYAAGRICKP